MNKKDRMRVIGEGTRKAASKYKEQYPSENIDSAQYHAHLIHEYYNMHSRHESFTQEMDISVPYSK